MKDQREMAQYQVGEVGRAHPAGFSAGQWDSSDLGFPMIPLAVH